MAESPVGFPGLFVLESSRMCAQKSPFSPQCYNTKHHLPHCNPSSDFPPQSAGPHFILCSWGDNGYCFHAGNFGIEQRSEGSCAHAYSAITGS